MLPTPPVEFYVCSDGPRVKTVFPPQPLGRNKTVIEVLNFAPFGMGANRAGLGWWEVFPSSVSGILWFWERFFKKGGSWFHTKMLLFFDGIQRTLILRFWGYFLKGGTVKTVRTVMVFKLIFPSYTSVVKP